MHLPACPQPSPCSNCSACHDDFVQSFLTMTLLMFLLVQSSGADNGFAWYGPGNLNENCDQVCARLGQGACDPAGFQYAGTEEAMKSIKGTFDCVSVG